MTTLVETLRDPEKLGAVCRDGAVLIDAQMKAKRGVRATALKAGYKTVKSIKPGVIEEVLHMLLPEFAPAVDPFYAQARESGNVRRFFQQNADAIADAMLGVTDARAARAKNRVMKRVYNSLRGQAKKHTSEAVPELAPLIEKHVG